MRALRLPLLGGSFSTGGCGAALCGRFAPSPLLPVLRDATSDDAAGGASDAATEAKKETCPMSESLFV